LDTIKQKIEFNRLQILDGIGPESLSVEWHVETHRQELSLMTFFDTFEWGLWFGDHILFRLGDTYHLCSRVGGWPNTELYNEATPRRPQFWHDFATRPMQKALKPMLGLRALSVVAEGSFTISLSELRNQEGKIVCRLEWTSVAAASQADKEMFRVCRILPLRGYEDEAARVAGYIIGLGTTITSTKGPLDFLLKQGGRTPNIYTLRPLFGITYETPARKATGQIVRTLQAIMQRTIPGILEDVDTEFLHDYRICLRKIRALLSLVKHVYPPEEVLIIRTMLVNLARQTNHLRDLDVYLLAHDEFRALLPPQLKPSLEPLFADVEIERKEEVRRTTALLRKRAHHKALQDLEAFFAEETTHKPSLAADLPIGQLAFRTIYRRYRKICLLAKDVTADTADHILHQIRIECKKLRYLMEFFSELIPHKDEAVLLHLLRRLQGRLGEFNDASVQQKALLDYCEQKNPKGDILLGLGGLVSVLYQRQQQMRSSIKKVLNEFCDTSTADIFKKAFKHPKFKP
jgi:CHAD domain-containing protein